MLGAIAGDIAGSAREWASVNSTDFELFPENAEFTDDSVLTVAVAAAIMDAPPAVEPDYRKHIHEYGRKWPGRGYGGMFRSWLSSANPTPYNSYGNGSAMRVSPVGWAFDDEKSVLDQAALSASPTHNHPEGVKGAQSVALAIFLGRTGCTKDEIRSRIENEFGYDLQRTVDMIRPTYSFDVTCQGSVPEAIIAFLDSVDFESAIRNAISLGGDADTQACIAGSVAEAFYGGLPAEIHSEVRKRIAPPLLKVLDDFRERFRLN